MTTEKKCSVEGCKHEYRAKGYCSRHYKKWRQGELPHGRYKTCLQETCRKKQHLHGLCEEHFNAKYAKKAEEAAATSAPAA